MGGDGEDAAGDSGMDLPDLPVQDEDLTPGQREVLLAKIRRQALELLTRPRWRQWAQDMLGWAEENLLSHMEDMFPAAGHFQTPETFRFLQLRSLHPGASFAKELLKAAAEEPLDLAKVCAAFVIPSPFVISDVRHMLGICLIGIAMSTPIARNLLSPRCRHMPHIFFPTLCTRKANRPCHQICRAYAWHAWSSKFAKSQM